MTNNTCFQNLPQSQTTLEELLPIPSRAQISAAGGFSMAAEMSFPQPPDEHTTTHQLLQFSAGIDRHLHPTSGFGNESVHGEFSQTLGEHLDIYSLDFPIFNGSNPRMWIEQCNNFFDSFPKISDVKRIDLAIWNFEGRAFTWIIELPIDDVLAITWKQFCEVVCSRFDMLKFSRDDDALVTDAMLKVSTEEEALVVEIEVEENDVSSLKDCDGQVELEFIEEQEIVVADESFSKPYLVDTEVQVCIAFDMLDLKDEDAENDTRWKEALEKLGNASDESFLSQGLKAIDTSVETFAIYPFPQISIAIVEHYNSLLYTHSLLEHTDVAVLLTMKPSPTCAANHLILRGPLTPISIRSFLSSIAAMKMVEELGNVLTSWDPGDLIDCLASDGWDTHSMLGQSGGSIECYKEVFKIQMESPPASLDEAADHRLLALICEATSNYEAALEHLILAGMTMIASGQGNTAAAIHVSIGYIYLSLTRFDEVVLSYQKALTVLKSSKGDNHPLVASVFVRLADMYYKIGTLRESSSYCEHSIVVANSSLSGHKEYHDVEALHEEESSDDDVPATKKAPAAAAKKAPAAKKESSDSDDDSSSDEDEALAKKAAVALAKKAAAPAKKDSSSDESEEEESSSDEETPAAKKAPVAPAASKKKEESSEEESEEEESSSDDEDEPQKKKIKSQPAAQTAKKSNSSVEDESEEEESSDEEEKPAKTPKKSGGDVKMAEAAKTPAPKTPSTSKEQSGGGGSKTLFVGNLSLSVEQADVENFFKPAGEVVDVRFAMGQDNNFRGFGHVEFATAEAAEKALKMNGQELLGREVRLDLAKERGISSKLITVTHLVCFSSDPRGRGTSSGGGIVMAYVGMDYGGDGMKKERSMLVGVNVVKHNDNGMKYICSKSLSSDPRGRGSYRPRGIVMNGDLKESERWKKMGKLGKKNYEEELLLNSVKKKEKEEEILGF